MFRVATRSGVKPLIDLYGESGTGKTYSALLLARGMAGDGGRIAVIDTESGRASLYADMIPGGYEVLDLEAPFSPGRYVEAIEQAEAGGYDVLVIDSISHEWEGLGGVLDLAGDNEARSGKPGLHNWKTPKMEHAKLLLKLLQSKLPIICCLRAKCKSRQVKNAHGRTEIIRDDFASPIQSEDFIFEATAHAQILDDHTIRLTKCSHPALRECFPADGSAPLTIDHGKAIAAWAGHGSGSLGTKPQIAGKETEAAKKKLWKLAKGTWPEVKEFEQHLWDSGLMGEEESLSMLGLDRIEKIYAILLATLEKKNV